MNKSMLMLVAALVAGEAYAATITWTGGAGDWDYGAAGNWSPNLPRNNDWADVVVFGAGATPGTISVVTPFGTDTTPQHEGVRFESAGWMLNVDYQDLGYVHSSGAGTNTINYGFEIQQAGTWTIGSGNTLSINGVLYGKNFNVSLTGGGTLHTTKLMEGYGSGTWGMHLKDGVTLRVDGDRPYGAASAGKLYIFDSTAKLELKTSVSNATSMIGTRIIDENSLGLQVTDIGGGYVQVSVPEPTSAMVLSTIAMGSLLVRRHRMA